MKQLSVIMGAYNCGQFINEAVESIRNQTLTDYDFIICEDGSKDDTLAKLKKWASIDKRIKLIINNSNYGLAYSLNRCLEQVNTKYVIRMDGDDISYSNRFEKMLDEIESRPDYAVVGSGCELFDDQGIWGNVCHTYDVTKEDAFFQHVPSHATVIMRTDALKDVGGYDTNSDSARAEDYDLWCRFAERGYRIVSISDILYSVRWDRNNYYTRRPLKTKLAWAKLVSKWDKRFNMGIKGKMHVAETYIKAFIPGWIKSLYHHYHLK